MLLAELLRLFVVHNSLKVSQVCDYVRFTIHAACVRCPVFNPDSLHALGSSRIRGVSKMKFALQAMLGVSVGCSVVYVCSNVIDGCNRWIQRVNED